MAKAERMPEKVLKALVSDPEGHRKMSSAGGLAAAAMKREKADQNASIREIDEERIAREQEFDRVQAGEDIIPPNNID